MRGDHPRRLELVVLDERLADRQPPRLEERVGHRPADRQRVHLAEQVLDHLELVGHLRAAEDRHERPLGRAERLAEVLHFLLQQQAGGRLRQELRDRLDRGVRPVARSERVVHVHVGRRGQLPGELGVVLLFFGMEPQVLEQHHLAALLRAFHGRLRRRADAVLGELHRDGPAAPTGVPATGRIVYSRFTLPLGLPRCDARMTVAPCSSAYLDRRERRADPRVVLDLPPLIGTLKSTRMKTRLPRGPGP